MELLVKMPLMLQILYPSYRAILIFNLDLLNPLLLLNLNMKPEHLNILTAGWMFYGQELTHLEIQAIYNLLSYIL